MTADGDLVDHRQLAEYFIACIEAENRARGSFRLDATVLQYPRGAEPVYDAWTDLPETSSTERWLRDRRLSAQKETVNVGWPLVSTGGREAAVAPLFVAEAELDMKEGRVRATASSMSVSPAALRAAGFEGGMIDSLLLHFDGHDDLTPDGLRAWTTKVGLAESLGVDGSTIQATAVVFVGDESSQITFFLVQDLHATAKQSSAKLRPTALGAVLGGATAAEPTWQPTPAALPTNLAQERACQLALAHPLTVVTGPPGTGKSQVLVNTAIAALCDGETVLIASRNNHAIDVVLERLEAIDPAVLAPRVGKKDLRGETARTMLNALDRTSADARRDDAEASWTKVAGRLREPFDALRQRARLSGQIDDLEIEIDSLTSALPARLHNWTPDEDPDLIRASFATATDARNALVAAPHRWFWQKRRARRQRRASIAAVQRTVALMGPAAGAALDDMVIDQLDTTFDLIATTLSLQSRRRARDDLRTRLSLLASDDDIEDLVNAVDRRRDTAVRFIAAQLAHARRPGSPAAAAARDFATSLATVATKGSGVRALPDKFPGALQAFPLWVTTSLAASSLLPITPGLFDLVIIDEAGQADFASAMPLLARAKRAMVVGDPQQLQHITQISARAEEHLAKKAGIPDLVQSQFNYIANSLYGVVANRLDFQPTLLRDHYRSHPDIIGISNRAFYGDRLRVRTELVDRGLVPVEWVDTRGTFERGLNGRSGKNVQEAHEAVRIAEQLATQGLSVGIVSPFRAQVDAIRRLVGQAGAEREGIAVDTAHGFQGDERDAVVFSLVVTGDAGEFLWGHAGNRNLVNVAITRARQVLRIVGDREACLRSKTVLNELAHTI